MDSSRYSINFLEPNENPPGTSRGQVLIFWSQSIREGLSLGRPYRRCMSVFAREPCTSLACKGNRAHEEVAPTRTLQHTKGHSMNPRWSNGWSNGGGMASGQRGKRVDQPNSRVARELTQTELIASVLFLSFTSQTTEHLTQGGVTTTNIVTPPFPLFHFFRTAVPF